MTAVDNPIELANISLFKGLNEEELSFLNDLLNRKVFPAGTQLMSSEQPGDVIYVVLTGTLKIYLLREDGTEVILAILGPGQTVGEMGLVDSAGRSANVVTMESCTLLWMDAISFRQSLKTMPALSFNMIKLLGQRLRLANEQVQALSSLDVAGRVARQILAFADQCGEARREGGVTIPLRLTQSDLAALVGTSREGVNRVIVRFKERGLIDVDKGHHITVLERDKLAARCR